MLLPCDLRDRLPGDRLVHSTLDAAEQIPTAHFRVNHWGTGSERCPSHDDAGAAHLLLRCRPLRLPPDRGSHAPRRGRALSLRQPSSRPPPRIFSAPETRSTTASAAYCLRRRILRPRLAAAACRCSSRPERSIEGFRPKRIIGFWPSAWELDDLPRWKRLYQSNSKALHSTLFRACLNTADLIREV